jgi:geranylgeranyl diphosphate synthase, type II
MANESGAPGALMVVPAADYELLRDAARQLVDVPFGIERSLRSALAATLATPGSLWRAQLAWATGRAEGLTLASALALACAVESFHVASLLLDDLPAMDDASIRRGRPCVHRLYGEPAALLAALAFVHEGHLRVAAALDASSPEIRVSARRLLGETLGVTGILDGQARDLNPGTKPASRDEILRQAAGKSVPLLVLALELPAVLAGAPSERRALLRDLAEDLGLAYQLLDDLEDCDSGEIEVSNASRDLGGNDVRREIAARVGRARAVLAELASDLPSLRSAVEGVLDRLAGAAASAA